MGVTVHLVRHAQGFHNLCVENEVLADPLLTDLGKQQCDGVRTRFQHHSKLTHLVASPLRRTLYTCLYSFGPHDPASATATEDARGATLLPVIALPELQEVSDANCDTGSDVPVLAAEFGDRVDFSRVPAGWNEKFDPASPWQPTIQKLEARAAAARLFLRDLAAKSRGEEEDDDVQIAVVSHGGFLHFLTDDWHGTEPPRATAWENCEFRSYHFSDPSGQDPEAHLKETDESWKARHGDVRRPTLEEQEERRRTYHRELAPWMTAVAQAKAKEEANGNGQVA